MYYPWNDGNDYNRLCYTFQKQLLFNDEKLIIHIGKGGGLGHKLVSLLRSITYALLNNRPLRCLYLFNFLFNSDNATVILE